MNPSDLLIYSITLDSPWVKMKTVYGLHPEIWTKNSIWISSFTMYCMVAFTICCCIAAMFVAIFRGTAVGWSFSRSTSPPSRGGIDIQGGGMTPTGGCCHPELIQCLLHSGSVTSCVSKSRVARDINFGTFANIVLMLIGRQRTSRVFEHISQVLAFMQCAQKAGSAIFVIRGTQYFMQNTNLSRRLLLQYAFTCVSSSTSNVTFCHDPVRSCNQYYGQFIVYGDQY